MLQKVNIVTIGELTFGNILRVEGIYVYCICILYMYYKSIRGLRRARAWAFDVKWGKQYVYIL